MSPTPTGRRPAANEGHSLCRHRYSDRGRAPVEAVTRTKCVGGRGSVILMGRKWALVEADRQRTRRMSASVVSAGKRTGRFTARSGRADGAIKWQLWAHPGHQPLLSECRVSGCGKAFPNARLWVFMPLLWPRRHALPTPRLHQARTGRAGRRRTLGCWTADVGACRSCLR